MLLELCLTRLMHVAHGQWVRGLQLAESFLHHKGQEVLALDRQGREGLGHPLDPC